jgi:hypothetical protein
MLRRSNNQSNGLARDSPAASAPGGVAARKIFKTANLKARVPKSVRKTV